MNSGKKLSDRGQQIFSLALFEKNVSKSRPSLRGLYVVVWGADSTIASGFLITAARFNSAALDFATEFVVAYTHPPQTT